jgi:hypothetical protein
MLPATQSLFRPGRKPPQTRSMESTPAHPIHHPLIPAFERDGQRALRIVFVIALIYYLLAYWITPALWTHYEHHPELEKAQKTTFTKEGIPGDALNIGLVGTEEDVIHSMVMAGWLPADPITFRTSTRITTSALFGKPYPNAPVSNLYVFGRIEDLAFEQAVPGKSRQRHHVRYWRSDTLGRDGRPFWIGAVTFDRSVGVSHLTGKITHHIDGDIDAERDKIIADLTAQKQLTFEYQVTGLGATLQARNGGGDIYYTDGELSIGVLTASGAQNQAPVKTHDSPIAVQAKNGVWTILRRVLHWF